ncbi:hypothetical protein [Streptomyces scabiei]|uniref:hypothetical protein n=1 Tax=Streptomyces scabiei TaxID=1930 RepID=UPI001B329A11|nr:hypothetical protein [Streptomyces sp. LBUM 1487]
MIVGLGCLGVVVAFVILGAIGAVIGSDDKASKGTSVSANDNKGAEAEEKADAPVTDSELGEAAKDTKPEEPKKTEKPKKQVVTFKVWGTAPPASSAPSTSRMAPTATPARASSRTASSPPPSPSTTTRCTSP